MSDQADEIAAETWGKLRDDTEHDLRVIVTALRDFAKAERERCHKIATHIEFPSGRHLSWQEIADRIEKV